MNVGKVLDFNLIPNYFIYKEKLHNYNGHIFYYYDIINNYTYVPLDIFFEDDYCEVSFTIACANCWHKARITINVNYNNISNYKIYSPDKALKDKCSYTHFIDYSYNKFNKYYIANKNQLDNFNISIFKNTLIDTLNSITYKSRNFKNIIKDHKFKLFHSSTYRRSSYHYSTFKYSCKDCNLQLSLFCQHRLLDIKTRIVRKNSNYIINEIKHPLFIDNNLNKLKKLSCNEIMIENILQ